MTGGRRRLVPVCRVTVPANYAATLVGLRHRLAISLTLLLAVVSLRQGFGQVTSPEGTGEGDGDGGGHPPVGRFGLDRAQGRAPVF